MKQIDIHECHNILIKIAAAFHEICMRHQIPYYMIGGTMLGAIRHNGFIPWDDDMDFAVERTYYAKLQKVLTEELPAHLKVRTLNNSNFIFTNYFKIEDNRTEICDHWHDSPLDFGISIDIFPLDKGQNSYWQTRLFATYIFSLLMIKDFLLFDIKYRRGLKKLLAIVLQKTNMVPIQKRLKYINNCIIRNAKEQSGYIVNYYGKWQNKEIMQKKIVGTPQLYPFQNMNLAGVEHAEAYLSLLYGDYMQLPPKEERTNHLTAMKYK